MQKIECFRKLTYVRIKGLKRSNLIDRVFYPKLCRTFGYWQTPCTFVFTKHCGLRNNNDFIALSNSRKSFSTSLHCKCDSVNKKKSNQNVDGEAGDCSKVYVDGTKVDWIMQSLLVADRDWIMLPRLSIDRSQFGRAEITVDVMNFFWQSFH